jgi:hypothetical protein
MSVQSAKVVAGPLMTNLPGSVNKPNTATVVSTASIVTPILNAFVFQIQLMGFISPALTVPSVIPSAPITVVKRKLPKKDETLQPPTQIIVCLGPKADDLGWWSFGVKKMRYYVEITFVSPNNNDNASNLDLYTQWRQQIRNHFAKPPLVGCASVVDLDVLGGNFLPRTGKLSTLYDYQQIIVRVTTAEAN